MAMNEMISVNKNEEVYRIGNISHFEKDSVGDIFMKACERATEIPFNPKWSTGNGWFDAAVFDAENTPKVGNGRTNVAITPGKRVILFIGTRLGTVIVFSRHDLNSENPVFVYMSNSAVREAFCLNTAKLDQHTMLLLVGDEVSPNIGHRIEDIYSLCKRRDQH